MIEEEKKYSSNLDKNRIYDMTESCAESICESLGLFLERHNLENLTDGGLIVDMGCGPGALLNKLKEKFPKAQFLGIDRNPNIIERAAKEHPAILFKTTDMLDTKLSDSSTSIVVSAAIIDYSNGTMDANISIPDYANEVYRILIPKGIYFPFDEKFDEQCGQSFQDTGFKKHKWLSQNVFQK